MRLYSLYGDYQGKEIIRKFGNGEEGFALYVILVILLVVAGSNFQGLVSKMLAIFRRTQTFSY